MYYDNRRMRSIHCICLIAPHVRFVLAELPVDDLLQLTILNQLRRNLKPASRRPRAIGNRIVHHIDINILAVPMVHPEIPRTNRQCSHNPHTDANEYGRKIQVQSLHNHILLLYSSAIESSYIFICENQKIKTQNQASKIIKNLFYGIWFAMLYIRITYKYSIRITWFTPH